MGGDWNAHSPTPQSAGKRTWRDARRRDRASSTCLRGNPHRVRWRSRLPRRTRPEGARMGRGSGSPAVRSGLAAPRIRGLVPRRHRIVADARSHQNRRRVPSRPGTAAWRQGAAKGAASCRQSLFADAAPSRTKRVILAGTRLSPMPIVPKAHDLVRFPDRGDGPRHRHLASRALAEQLSEGDGSSGSCGLDARRVVTFLNLSHASNPTDCGSPSPSAALPSWRCRRGP